DGPGKRAELEHEPAALALVIAHPVDLEAEWGRGIGADVNGERLPGPDARSGRVALDPGAAIPGLGVDADLGCHPVARTGPLVLAADPLQVGGLGQDRTRSLRLQGRGQARHRGGLENLATGPVTFGGHRGETPIRVPGLSVAASRHA